MPKKVFSKHEPSEEFMDAICNAGGIRATCELCGREYFTSLECGYDYSEGEYEELCDLADKDPDAYIELHESVGYGWIDGHQVVYGCKCNGIRRYENWVWDNRRAITKYLDTRTRQEAQDALYERKMIEEIVGTPALLLLDWLKQEGWKVKEDIVHNGSFWMQVSTENQMTVRVGAVVFNAYDPDMFDQVAKYMENLSKETDEWMKKRGLLDTGGTPPIAQMNQLII